MPECERLFGVTRGLEIVTLVRRLTGDSACRCEQGLACPLVGQPSASGESPPNTASAAAAAAS